MSPLAKWCVGLFSAAKCLLVPARGVLTQARFALVVRLQQASLQARSHRAIRAVRQHQGDL
jgi:hypothetical protein